MERYNRKNMAVSEVLGTALLLGITVLLFSLLSVIVISYPSPSSSPSVNLVGTIEKDRVLIEHRGGDPLTLDTLISITIDEVTNSFPVSDYLDPEAQQDNQWGIGEWVVYQDESISGKTVGIVVIDGGTGSVVMTTILTSGA
jgi:FlaG/FlaF family flagellin (archaellin)